MDDKHRGPILNNSLWVPFQLGPQAHAEDTERGQHPVPAFSHHGCQVRILAVMGKAEGGARGPWGPSATLSPLDHNPSPHSNLGWLSYGVLKGDGTLIIVNTVGAVLQTLYILAYLHYSPQKVEAHPSHPPLLHALPR